MTDLTEQWKNGELKEGEYWCKITESPYVERVYLPCCDDIIVEVLAPVPSYEEYLESESHCAVYSEVNKSLKEQNQQLKDVISKMCMELVDPDDNMSNGLAEYFNQDLLLKIQEVLK